MSLTSMIYKTPSVNDLFLTTLSPGSGSGTGNTIQKKLGDAIAIASKNVISDKMKLTNVIIFEMY